MKKILVIQTAFIGDVVLATGIIEKLHQYYPEASIDFMVRKGNEGLLAGHPFLHEVLIWDKREHKQINLWKMLFRIRAARYDYVINVQRFMATGILTAFSGAKRTIGFDKNPLSFLFTNRIHHKIGAAPSYMHEIARNHELISSLTDSIPAKPKLYPSDSDFQAVSALKQKPYIIIAPASVWYTKQYPKEKWISFINRIPHHYSVYLIGAPGDHQLAEFIRQDTSHPGVQNLCGQYNFLQSAALQKDAVMNFVNDSAPMHFASAVNAPVTAVYCSTLPSFGFGPLSDMSYLVEISEPLACRPCGLHGKKECPLGHFHCAIKIRDEQLLACLDS